MDWQTVKFLLLNFQTTIVGFFGFSGVIITLYVNARIARNSREAAIRQERINLRTALIEELKILGTACENNVQVTNEAISDGSKGVLVPLENLTAVYDSQLQHLGLLKSDEVAKVLHAYLVVKREPMLLRAFPGAEIQHELFLYIRKPHLEHLNRLKRDMKNSIDDALKVLESNRNADM